MFVYTINLNQLCVSNTNMNLITGDEFTVYVATGNQDMADTEADVFCCLIGQFGDTGRRMLSKSNCQVPFKKGQVKKNCHSNKYV